MHLKTICHLEQYLIRRKVSLAQYAFFVSSVLCSINCFSSVKLSASFFLLLKIMGSFDDKRIWNDNSNKKSLLSMRLREADVIRTKTEKLKRASWCNLGIVKKIHPRFWHWRKFSIAAHAMFFCDFLWKWKDTLIAYSIETTMLECESILRYGYVMVLNKLCPISINLYCYTYIYLKSAQ